MKQEYSSDFFDEKFDKVVGDVMTQAKIPGFSVGIYHKGKVYAKGYGYADIETKEPMTPESMCFMGSTTKSFTAASYAILASQPLKYNGVTWKTPISKIVPDDFVTQDEYTTKHATVEDALSHVTGALRYDRSTGDPLKGNAKIATRTMRHVPIPRELRERWSYANTPFSVVSHIVETLSGLWLGDFFREKIWEPLGMKDSFFCIDDALKHAETNKSSRPDLKMAKGYSWVPSNHDGSDPDGLKMLRDDITKGHWAHDLWQHHHSNSGAGSNISTVLDYLRYATMMMHKEEPLPPSAHEELTKPRALIPQDEHPGSIVSGQKPPLIGTCTYSLGWIQETQVRDGRAYYCVQHGGGVEGFGCDYRYFPDLDLATIIVGNTMWAGPAGTAIFEEIFSRVAGFDSTHKFDWLKELTAQEVKREEGMVKAKEKIFAPIAGQNEPCPVSLKDLTGRWSHPGYSDFIITEHEADHSFSSTTAGPYLHLADAQPMTWRGFTNLFHVSGPWFMCELVRPHSPPEYSRAEYKHLYKTGNEGVLQGRGRAKLRLDRDGKVFGLGVEFEPSLPPIIEKKFRPRRDEGPDGKEVEAEPGKGFDWDVEQGMIWLEKVD